MEDTFPEVGHGGHGAGRIMGNALEIKTESHQAAALSRSAGVSPSVIEKGRFATLTGGGRVEGDERREKEGGRECK